MRDDMDFLDPDFWEEIKKDSGRADREHRPKTNRRSKPVIDRVANSLLRAVDRTRASLEQELKTLESKGLQLDTEKLRRNICSQFPQHRLWIREYIVNAFDAQARSCKISGTEEDGRITINVADDGHGMDRQGVETFLRKFSSRKNLPETAVGRFGIGSFSVAAIPGQCGFSMVTSTGGETWRMKTGNLLESKPIDVERITPVQPVGTTFSITFQKPYFGLAKELHELQQLARKYVYHLPINIYFAFPIDASKAGLSAPDWIPGNWTEDPEEKFSKRFCFTIQGKVYDVVLGVGHSRQQLYQKRVLIAEDRPDYDLLSQDFVSQKVSVDHLSIRVDSPQFEMPLGRHCLSDREVLKPLAWHLRERVLPQFMTELVQIYESSSTDEFLVKPSEVENMLSTWMATVPNEVPERFRKVSIFRTQDRKRISYEQLCQAADQHGAVYLEDIRAGGLDYSVFEAPVLSLDQPSKGLQLIRARLGKRLINLHIDGFVCEAPTRERPKLSASEQRFGQMLGFRPETLWAEQSRTFNRRSEADFPRLPMSRSFPPLPEKVAAQLRSEMKKAGDDLGRIKWEVGHLMQRDGKTPCTTALFLCKGERVILNLSHPDIVKLVALSEKSPNLAGHFATALCLSRDGRSAILDHIPQERREALIYLDAISRCSRGNRLMPGRGGTENARPATTNLNLQDFLRQVAEDDFRS